MTYLAQVYRRFGSAYYCHLYGRRVSQSSNQQIVLAGWLLGSDGEEFVCFRNASAFPNFLTL
jgi:hypothetical protein